MAVSPVGTGLTQGRTDQGVDWSGSGLLYAVDSGTIISTTNPGWPGGSFIALQLDNPPDPQHSVVYYAEDIDPKVQVGQAVQAGQVIGQATGGSSGIEIGWGNPGSLGQALAMGASGATAAGQNFLDYINGATQPSGGGGGSTAGQSTGAPFTPSGIAGVPATPPSFPQGTGDPLAEISNVVAWGGEFASWAFFTMLVFIFGATLMLLGLVMLMILFVKPAAQPVIQAATTVAPMGRAAKAATKLGGVAEGAAAVAA